MKKTLLKLTAVACLIITGVVAQAQTRFVDPVFTNVIKTSNIEYDTNRSINLLFGLVPGQQPIITASLKCDIYQPDGDTLATRPVILLASTGSYLPAIINKQPTGNKDDSSIVELAMHMAKRGYVVVAFNYRLGWNPQTTVQAVATEQLIKATFRALQDTRNCVRFLKQNATTYKLDMNKVIMGGQGTGGYIALAIAAVDKQEDIDQNLKFLRSDLSPMVNVDTMGNWRGVGGSPFFNYGADTAVKDDIHMVFNYGGAMGDTAWMDNATLPIVGLHCAKDPFAPYKSGNVVVPTTGVTVIPNASGAGDVVPYANAKGLNDKINAATFTDAITTRALATSNNVKNLYTFQTTAVEGAPWEWWDRAIVQGINVPSAGAGREADSLSMLTNPNMSATKAKAYIDTIAKFISPRIAAQFDLANFSTSVREVSNYNQVISMFPNPAQSIVKLSLPVAIQSVSIMDVMGRVVLVENNIQSTTYQADINGLNTGVYFVKVNAVDGKSAVKRLVIR
jgi:hypothetical protein